MSSSLEPRAPLLVPSLRYRVISGKTSSPRLAQFPHLTDEGSRLVNLSGSSQQLSFSGFRFKKFTLDLCSLASACSLDRGEDGACSQPYRIQTMLQC